MFNPDRPMVMYESMSLALDNLDLPSPGLELHSATLEAAGKRGNVLLEYRLTADNKPVGEVTKRLVLSGLRPYSPEAMAGVIEEFYRLGGPWHRLFQQGQQRRPQQCQFSRVIPCQTSSFR